MITNKWFNVCKLSEISATEDGEREFLEAIPGFRIAEKRGWIADSGYLMPPIGFLVVGRVHEIEFIPDQNNPIDGNIFVRKTDITD